MEALREKISVNDILLEQGLNTSHNTTDHWKKQELLCLIYLSSISSTNIFLGIENHRKGTQFGKDQFKRSQWVTSYPGFFLRERK